MIMPTLRASIYPYHSSILIQWTTNRARFPISSRAPVSRPFTTPTPSPLASAFSTTPIHLSASRVVLPSATGDDGDSKQPPTAFSDGSAPSEGDSQLDPVTASIGSFFLSPAAVAMLFFFLVVFFGGYGVMVVQNAEQSQVPILRVQQLPGRQ